VSTDRNGRKHTPAGRPAGGRFASAPRPEQIVDLTDGPARPTASDVTFGPEEGGWGEWVRPGNGSPAFDRAVRTLLGVDDPGAPVSVDMAGGNTGSTYTPQEWSQIEVRCAGVRREFTDLPHLLAAFDLASAPPVDTDRLAAMRGMPVVVTFPGGATWHGQVANTSGAHLVLLVGDEPGPRGPRQVRGAHTVGGRYGWTREDGRWALRDDPQALVSVEVDGSPTAEQLARADHDTHNRMLPQYAQPWDEMDPARRQRLVEHYAAALARVRAG
jgi:hypothetical protein